MNQDLMASGDNIKNRGEIELELVNFFRAQLQLENKLERVKTDLALRTDFNLIDGFRIFDSDGKSWITASELKDGLSGF